MIELKEKRYVFTCVICHRPIPLYRPSYCCDGMQCSCMAEPINPPACSDVCKSALESGIGTSFEERRKMMHIKLYEAADN